MKKRDEALRIRTSTDCRSGISKTQINFKGPKLDKVSMSRMELETEVSDTEVLKNILIHLDFSPVASVIKLRKYLKCGRFTACLDQVEGLGDFLELEVIAEQESEREEIFIQDGRSSCHIGISHVRYCTDFLSQYASEKGCTYRSRWISCLIRLNWQEYFRISI